MLKSSLKTIALSLITLSLLGIAYAWTEPTSTPPNGNTSIPLTNSSIGQIKTGALQVNGLWNNGTTLLDGNVGIGTITPAQKLSVAGTIESTFGGIKFPDGTVQTSAAIKNSTAVYWCPDNFDSRYYCKKGSCSDNLSLNSTCFSYDSYYSGFSNNDWCLGSPATVSCTFVGYLAN